MNDNSGLPPEVKLLQDSIDWWRQGEKLVAAFRQKGMPVPKMLLSVVETKEVEGHAKSLILIPPAKPDAPPEAKDDWRWIRATEVSQQTIVLAMLRKHGKLAPKALLGMVVDILGKDKEINPGTVYNIGPRLEGKKIKRSEDGWELLPGQEVPILYKGYIWAPPNLLSVHELASFRRMAVLHLMGGDSDGIRAPEIFKKLKGVDWLKTPISKDLIQDDLTALESAGKVKQMGRSKKWKLTAEGSTL